MKRILITSILLGSFLVAGISQTENLQKLGKDPVKKVIAAMSLEEKAALVVGTGMRMPVVPLLPVREWKYSRKSPANLSPCNWHNSKSCCRSGRHYFYTATAGNYSNGSD